MLSPCEFDRVPGRATETQRSDFGCQVSDRGVGPSHHGNHTGTVETGVTGRPGQQLLPR